MLRKMNKLRYTAIAILLFMMLPLLLPMITKAESLTEEGESITYDYAATVEEYTAVLPGFYKLEVWGARGGIYYYPEYNGQGGYASGSIYLNKGDKLYICVGGVPVASTDQWGRNIELGGYNGGGNGMCSGGGGATHIALNSDRGVLKNYENYKDEILIVAGGAGGDTGYGSGGINGGSGGGYSGTSYGNSVNVDFSENEGESGGGGTQTSGGSGGCYETDGDNYYSSGGSFGQGGDAEGNTAGGGGGGWYGGGGGASCSGGWGAGGGGSGYVGGVYSGYMETGVCNGNGAARITLAEIDTSAIGSGGGSSYAGTDFGSKDASMEAGVNAGDGQITLSSGDIGYLAATSLAGVTATDKAAPDAVSTQAGNVTFAVVENDETRIEVAWEEPADNGTDYYHKVESFLADSLECISISNVTKNTLTSGVVGYYYVLDQTEHTAVTLFNGTYITDSRLEVSLTATTQYFHVAAVDKAGNLSGTSTIELSKETMESLWPIYTMQMEITNATGDSTVTGIYPAAADKTWYVRCDGETPIDLSFESYIKGAARDNYQINRSIFEEQVTVGAEKRSIIETPMHAIATEEITTTGSSLGDFSDDNMLIQGDAGLKTVRSSNNKVLDVTRPFTVLPDADGKTIRVIPVAGIVTEALELYSNYEEDKEHGIYLIGDGTAPEIGGMEIFETDLFTGGSPVNITLTASDTGSGVNSFYAVFANTENLLTKTFTSTDHSTLSMELSEDSLLLSGNVTVEVYAVDNVGNKNMVSGSISGFILEAGVERMLEPHDPIFRCGESGILTIVTKGYAERVTVEFPEAMSGLDADLNTTFDYTGTRAYLQEEKLEFMIPLCTPENENYVITVRAYKGERELVAHPDLCTIEVKGSILNEVRTRLR